MDMRAPENRRGMKRADADSVVVGDRAPEQTGGDGDVISQITELRMMSVR